jgi:hypothetical protein
MRLTGRFELNGDMSEKTDVNIDYTPNGMKPRSLGSMDSGGRRLSRDPGRRTCLSSKADQRSPSQPEA